MRPKLLYCLVLTLLVTVPVGIARGQNSTNDQKHEQTAFDAEPDSDAMHMNMAKEIPDSDQVGQTSNGGPKFIVSPPTPGSPNITIAP
jgi:hypothetical protein